MTKIVDITQAKPSGQKNLHIVVANERVAYSGTDPKAAAESYQQTVQHETGALVYWVKHGIRPSTLEIYTQVVEQNQGELPPCA